MECHSIIHSSSQRSTYVVPKVNEDISTSVVGSDSIRVEPPWMQIGISGIVCNKSRSNKPFWNCEQLKTARVNGLPPLTCPAGAGKSYSVNVLSITSKEQHALFGEEMVRVAPMGLVEFEFVQSANRYQ